MKKFKFKFQVILEKAEEEVQECILKLKQVREILDEALKRYEDFKNEKLSIINQMKQWNSNGFNIVVFKEKKVYIEELNRRIKKAKEEIKKIEIIEEERLKQLKESKKQLNVYEKLKEKQYKDYLEKARKQEEKELEELVMNKYTN